MPINGRLLVLRPKSRSSFSPFNLYSCSFLFLFFFFLFTSQLSWEPRRRVLFSGRSGSAISFRSARCAKFRNRATFSRPLFGLAFLRRVHFRFRFSFISFPYRDGFFRRASSFHFAKVFLFVGVEIVSCDSR